MTTHNVNSRVGFSADARAHAVADLLTPNYGAWSTSGERVCPPPGTLKIADKVACVFIVLCQ